MSWYSRYEQCHIFLGLQTTQNPPSCPRQQGQWEDDIHHQSFLWLLSSVLVCIRAWVGCVPGGNVGKSPGQSLLVTLNTTMPFVCHDEKLLPLHMPLDQKGWHTLPKSVAFTQPPGGQGPDIFKGFCTRGSPNFRHPAQKSTIPILPSSPGQNFSTALTSGK